ncbi:unnamed protein product [Rotaria sp. Silwood1]|nr:unnamed protein product [Rotaria sp. Silwood1]
MWEWTTSTKKYYKYEDPSCTVIARTDFEAILLNIKSDCCHPSEPEKIQIQTFKQVVKARAISESTPIPQIYGEEAARIDLSTLSIAALPSQRELSQKNRYNIIGRNWINALHLNETTLNDIIFNSTVLNVNSEIENLNHLIKNYKDIFKEGLRSLPFAYRQAVESDLDRLVSECVLKPVNIAKWAAPIVVVPKPGGKVRICADFSTGVNQALGIDQYPLPKPNDLFVALNGGTQFSKVDFSEAYLQVELDDESKELLIINTHKGLFQFNPLPFGVASAPSIFQKIMDQMLAGLEGTVCCLDDITVTGKNKIDHFNNLNKVFIRLKEYRFHINIDKCIFLQYYVEYLGFIVDKNGIHTLPSKTKAIMNVPKPTNITQLRSFLGIVNHYAKFIPKLTDRVTPYYSLLKKDNPIQKFDQFLCGRKFTLLTDHKPLLTIFGPKKGIPTTSANRLQRWAVQLMGFAYDIKYCSTKNFDPGKVRLVASIPEKNQNELPLRALHVAQATRKDPVLMQVYHYVLSGWPSQHPENLQPYFRMRNELSTSHGCII